MATTRFPQLSQLSHRSKIPDMLPRRLLAWILTLALIFSQAAAFAHALTHLDPHDSALPDKVCEVCVAQAQLGSAVPSGQVTLVPFSHTGFDLPAITPLRVDLSPRAACARAPPTSFNR